MNKHTGTQTENYSLLPPADHRQGKLGDHQGGNFSGLSMLYSSEDRFLGCLEEL